MSNLKSKLAGNLSTITEYCNDSVKGYDDAAESIQETNTALAAEFRAQASCRRGFSERLSERLMCIGEDREDDGTISGAIHRGILKLKEAFSSDDIDAVVKECIRGEEELGEKIDDALSEKADAETSKLLLELKQNVTESIAGLRALKK